MSVRLRAVGAVFLEKVQIVEAVVPAVLTVFPHMHRKRVPAWSVVGSSRVVS